MYSHLSSVDCLSSHLSLKFIVEQPTHLPLLSFLGAFEKLSLLYTHVPEWAELSFFKYMVH